MKVQVKGKVKKNMSWNSHNWKDESGWKEGLMWEGDNTQKISKNVSWGLVCEFQVRGWGHHGKSMKSTKETTSLEVNGDTLIKLDY